MLREGRGTIEERIVRAFKLDWRGLDEVALLLGGW